MIKKYLVSSLLIVPICLVFGGSAEARSGYLTDFNNSYGTSGTALSECAVCHGASKSDRNSYGADLEGQFGGATGLKDIIAHLIAIEGLDSDGDGATNIDEIVALTLPGDASSTPGASGPVDADGDGSTSDLDCNDNDAAMFPGNPEVCDDAKDNDCNGLIDAEDDACGTPPACTDADGDGYSAEGGDCGAADCVDTNVDINPGACDLKSDGIDQDCSGKDRTKGKACPGNEPAPEICANGIDDDGDGRVDEHPCKK